MRHCDNRFNFLVPRFAMAIKRLARSSFAALELAMLVIFLPRPAVARDKISLMLDGVPRTAQVEPGRNAGATPSPLVFAFHGAGGKSADMTKLGLAQAWPDATFVYPDGLTRPSPLLGGTVSNWQTEPGQYGDQDVRFVDALLDKISATYQVDPRRIYATGFSNGNLFCDVLLTLRAEQFAAFALVAGGGPPCVKWARLPRPVLITEGTADPTLSFAEWSRDQILSLNGCSLADAQRSGGSTLFPSCASGQPVIFTAHSGGHEWPSGTTVRVVQFFQQQALPSDPPARMVPPAVVAGNAIAGSGRAGFSGDGAGAIAAQLLFPEAITLDAGGRLLIADTGNQRMRQVGLDGTIQTVAGQGASSSFLAPDRNNMAATRAHLLWPEGVVGDPDGGFYIADTLGHLVRHVTAAGQISTIAGKTPVANATSFSGDGGPGTKAQLSFPTGLAVDSHGNLFIADTENHRIRKLGPDGIIITVAGTGAPGFSGDGGPAAQAQLNEPWGLALDIQDNLYIADTFNHRVRKMAPDGTITTVAGTGTAGFAGDGGAATAAPLNHPLGLAVDSHGSLFIVDQWNYRVRRVAPDGTISTVFGAGGSEEGGAASSPLYNPSGVVVDSAGNLLIADPFNDRVWKVVGMAAPGLLGGRPFPAAQ